MDIFLFASLIIFSENILLKMFTKYFLYSIFGI